MSIPINTAGRPRPVLITLSVLAALDILTGTAGFTQHIPAGAAWWIITGLSAVHIGLAFYLQSVVTPLADPRDARGVPMVAADVASKQIAAAAASTWKLPTTTGEATQPE